MNYLLTKIKILLGYFTLNGYARASFGFKIFSLIMLSGLIILAFAYVLGLDASFRAFSEPSSIPDEIDNLFIGSVSIIEAILGLIVSSALIAVISQAYSEGVEGVKAGRYAYKGKNHYVVMNYSDKIHFVLEALNRQFALKKQLGEVVIMLHDDEHLDEGLKQVLRLSFKNLKILVKTGDMMSPSFYEKCNIPLASAVIVLNQNDESMGVKGDNFQVKACSAMLESAAVRMMIRKRLKSKDSLNIIVEIVSEGDVRQVLKNLCATYELPAFQTFESPWFKRNLMSAAIIDANYLGVFYELTNYHKQGVRVVDSSQSVFSDLIGRPFEESVVRIVGAQLIGLVDHQSNGDINYYLNPVGVKIEPSMGLVIVENVQNKIKILSDKDYEIVASKGQINNGPIVKVLTDGLVEQHNRSVLIIGQDGIRGRLDKMLDNKSISNMVHINHSSLPVTRAEVKEKIEVDSKFDTILINLEEEDAFGMYTELLFSDQFIDSNLKNKVMVILKKPENILRAISLNKSMSVFNEDAFLGDYVAQLMFDNRLMYVFKELVTIEGSEFYVVDVTDDMRQSVITSYAQMKYDLMMSGANYVGIVSQDNEIHFGQCDIDEIRKAKKLIILSKGEV